MFHSGRKTNQQDRNKNIAKFLDPKRDTHARLKALKILLELLVEHELKAFFSEYPSEIFFVFYEEFTNLELSAKSKGTKLKDELEELLVLLEKILIYIPDKIHARWHFNSIGLILRKLLHHGNVLTIREQGIRLFMLWLQILQSNVDELNLAVYGSIIPTFPSPISKIDIPSTYRSPKVLDYLISCINGQGYNPGLFNVSLESEAEWCVAEGCMAICPPLQGDKILLPDELTKKFLDKILDYMTRRMLDIQWHDRHMRESGFYHVFYHFKRFYLPHIFPLWNPHDYLYKEMTDIIHVPITDETSILEEGKIYQRGSLGQQPSSISMLCQCAVLRWLIAFAIRFKRKSKSSTDSKSIDSGSLAAQESTELQPISEDVSKTSASNDESSPATRSKQYELLCEAADIVRAVFSSTQENVLAVHEVFRQSFLMPLSCTDVMELVLLVYREWIFKIQDRPLFMLEPKNPELEPGAPDPRNCADNSPLLRTPSYKEAVTSCEQVFFSNLPVQHVRAGFQPNLRLFIGITAQVFFMKPTKESMSKHTDICKRIMKMYRSIVLAMRLDSLTWRQLLIVLLKIADHILTSRPPTPRHATIGGQLASYLLQTLFVTWIRASLQVYLTSDLWDELLRVGTTFSSWQELVKEWAGTMETLTRVMGRTVYGIDLQDPPLEKQTERGKIKKDKQRKISDGSPEERNQSFTRGWSQFQTQNQINLEQRTNQPAAEAVTLKPMQNPTFMPRSASEPGIKHTSMQKQHMVSILSEGSMSDTQAHMHVPNSEPALMILKTEEVIQKENKYKKTLAEIADNVSSFDSITSDTNSVFTHSFHGNYGTLQEALSHAPLAHAPKVNVQNSSDSESECNGLIMYETLKDCNSENSQSLGTINSYLNESSQNLLADEYESQEENLNEVVTARSIIKPSNYGEEKCETESYVASMCSDSTSHSEEPLRGHETLSAQVSISSDHDLINFALDPASKKSLDAQSIDSHMFTLIDNESFNELKSPGSISQDNIAEASEDEDIPNSHDVETTSRVRFTDDCSLSDNQKEQGEADKTLQDHKIFSVIEGGKVEGWTPLSSVILWKRILGILGNVNDIKDAEVHAMVFKHLIQLWEMLETIRRNQGVSIDNKSTPPLPPLSPPLYFCSTWCFQAMSSESGHKQGRVLAYKLMCMMTMKNHGLLPSLDHMIHFFRLIHNGLTGSDQEVVNAIISQCSLFFALEFSSSSCLLLDFVNAATTVISTQYMTHPRKEAISLLGSMICLPGAYPSLNIYQPGIRNHETNAPLLGKELREKILIPILKSAKNDPSCRARCVALNSLGLFVTESLVHLGGHQRIYDCFALLISSLEFHSQVVSTVALDVLWSLTFYYDYIEAFDKDLPLKIVEAICHVTLHIQATQKSSTSDLPPEESPEYISKLLLCLLDWIMVMPCEVLLRSRTDHDENLTYLGLAMKIFKKCSEDKVERLSLDRRRSLNINQLFVGENRPIRLARVHNDLSMDDPHGITDDDDFLYSDTVDGDDNVLPLTATYGISQILNYYQHFPFDTGAVQPSSLILESEDHDGGESVDDTMLLESHNVQFILLDDTTVLSVVELPLTREDTPGVNFDGPKTVSRFILRDQSGKHCWDIADVFTLDGKTSEPYTDLIDDMRQSLVRKHSRNLSVSATRLSSRASFVLPTWETVDANADRVDQLLRYIGHSSPECLLFPDQQLNFPAPVPDSIDVRLQSSVVTSVLKQHNEEENYVHEIAHDARITAREVYPPVYYDPLSSFHVSKMLLHQLGFFSWNKRPNIELLERNEKLLREIKNLDNRPSRETQKIAVFYVGAGQEDKHSILSNSTGSKKFEEFLSGMGWEVDLLTHTGFMGGLERNLSTGVSAPYFATHSLEVIFHVSTRMPGEGEEQLKTKFRHLGNDEVHIIWSEHNRDFRRGIINTEFADVMIVIYPLQNNLYRIQIDRNPKIPPFGPLFDGAIVDGDLLPRLVRSTAVSAGRAKRSTIKFYKRHFEERARCIRDIAKNRVRSTSFEDFVSGLFKPGQPPITTHRDSDDMDGIHRTFSAPSRTNTMTDPSAVLKLLDMPEQPFRGRVSSSITKQEYQVYRAASNTSLNIQHDDPSAVLSDSDQNKEYKDRRKSITKRLKKKASSVEIPMFGSTEKTGD